MWALITLASLIIIFILVLSVPLDFVFDINASRSPSFRFRLLWLFGLVDTELKKTGSKSEQKKKSGKEKPEKRKKIRAGTIYQVLQIGGLYDHIFGFFRGVLRSLKIKDLKVNIRIGLEDPSDTGLLFSITIPANYFFSYLPYDLSLQPSFDSETILEGNVKGDLQLKPIKLVSTTIKFIFSFQSIQILKIMIAEWKRKR